MEYARTVTVDAPADEVWRTLSDLRDWPAWTPTVESVETDEGGPVIGQCAAVKQPGRRVTRYTVDAVEPGRRFRWGSDRFGVRQSADHVVTADGPHACSVRLTFTMTGPVGAPLAVLGAGRIRAMVDAEAAGLRVYAERRV